MKNPNFIVMACIIITSTLLFVFINIDNQEKRKNPTINKFATVPDQMLVNANHYLMEHMDVTSKGYVTRAIDAIRLIQKSVDEESYDAIEKSIGDLIEIEYELENNSLDREFMNHTFINVLNTLAMVQLKVSEEYFKNGEFKKAKNALGYAFNHLHNTMRYTKENEISIEEHIYEEINLLYNVDLSETNNLIEQMDNIITELDTLKLE